MIKFEVHGATAEEFAENALKAWALLTIGLQNLATLRAAGIQPPQVVSEASQSSTVHSDTVVDLFPENPSASSMKPEPKTGSPSTHGTNGATRSTRTKGPKLDDLKARLSDVITAAVDRGWDIKRANAYAMKMLRELAVGKISDLSPERYADFMSLSEHYVAGTAAE